MAITKNQVPQIFNEDIFESINKDLTYWIKKISGYSCHLFVIQLTNVNTLKNVWEILSARIALGFQTGLPNDIEMFNIYLIFLSKERVSREIKYKIEQNKYCCRKLVEDELGEVIFTDNYIKMLIDEKIFSIEAIKISTEESNFLTNKNIESIINEKDKNILKVLKGYKASNVKFDQYYKKFIELSYDGK